MGHNQEIISEAVTTVSERTLRIRALNDALRTTFRGGDVAMTAGVDALPEFIKADIVTAVQTFTAFTEDNDPWGEHDCATLTVDGHDVMFKVDYYDTALEHHSPDESDPSVTRRVLTLLLTHEY